MNAKEKAKQLVNNFSILVKEKDSFGDNIQLANIKRCAVIAVEEMLEELEERSAADRFWRQVLIEIEKI